MSEKRLSTPYPSGRTSIKAAYEEVKRSGALTAEKLARLYNIPVDDVLVAMFFDAAMAFKMTVKRRGHQGSSGERDTFGTGPGACWIAKSRYAIGILVEGRFSLSGAFCRYLDVQRRRWIAPSVSTLDLTVALARTSPARSPKRQNPKRELWLPGSSDIREILRADRARGRFDNNAPTCRCCS